MRIRGIKKTNARLNRLSNICSDIAQIALASIVIPFLIDKFNPIMLVWGLVMTFTFWIFSILLAK